MSTQTYPFQFVSPQLGTLTLQCKLPKETAEKLASTLRSLVQLAEGRWYYELTGIQGQEVQKNGPFRLLFGAEDKAKIVDEPAYVQALQTFWNSLPTPITLDHLSTVQEAAHQLFEQHCPVVDKTETLEEIQARAIALAEAEAAQQAERQKIIAAYADNAEEITLEKGEMGIILALVYDNSDMMTDYYQPRSAKNSFLLARMRSQRRQERLLRQVLERYPALRSIEWTWHGSDKYSHGPDCYLKSKETYEYLGTPFKAYAGHEVRRVWYEIRFIPSGRYLPFKGFHSSAAGTSLAQSPASPEAIRIQYERTWTWLFFPEKPDAPTRTQLTQMGGRWGRGRGGWYFKRHIPEEAFAWLFETGTDHGENLSVPEDNAPAPPASAIREAPSPTGYIPGKGSAYEYIPPWMEVPPPYASEKQTDPLAVIKLFTPDSNWTWYLLEYDGHDLAFGLVAGFETEFGDFSLQEIASARGPLGVQPERDLWFCPTPVTQLPEYREKWGDNGPFRGGGGATATPSPEPDEPSPPTLPPSAAAAVIPEGWTEEDIAFLLTQLELGPILVADGALDFPTIHDIPNADHLGYGLFRATGDGYTLYFDGGGAMRRTPSGKGWTQLDMQGEYPYDLEAARAILERYLPSATHAQAEILTPGETVELLEETLSPEPNLAQTLTAGMLDARKPGGQAAMVEEGPIESAVDHPSQNPSLELEPTPDDQAEFEHWQLELLTGLVQKKDSAFYHALAAVRRPGVLHLALQQVNGDHLRRKRLEARLNALHTPA